MSKSSEVKKSKISWRQRLRRWLKKQLEPGDYGWGPGPGTGAA